MSKLEEVIENNGYINVEGISEENLSVIEHYFENTLGKTKKSDYPTRTQVLSIYSFYFKYPPGIADHIYEKYNISWQEALAEIQKSFDEDLWLEIEHLTKDQRQQLSEILLERGFTPWSSSTFSTGEFWHIDSNVVWSSDKSFKPSNIKTIDDPIEYFGLTSSSINAVKDIPHDQPEDIHQLEQRVAHLELKLEASLEYNNKLVEYIANTKTYKGEVVIEGDSITTKKTLIGKII